MIYKNIEDFVEEFRKTNDINKIKEQFKNVFFIIGTAYAGKSTMVKMLSEKFDGIMCEENYGLKFFKEYKVNPKDQPNLCYTQTHTMEEFVNRTPDEYFDWLRNSEMEITPIEIGELLKLTSKYPDKKIFVDTSIPPEILKLISSYDNVAVMLSEKSMSVNRFFERADYEKQIIFRTIKNSKDPEKTMNNYRKVLEKINSVEVYNHFQSLGFYVFKRDDTLSLEQTRDVLAKHFKLKEANKVETVLK